MKTNEAITNYNENYFSCHKFKKNDFGHYLFEKTKAESKKHREFFKNAPVEVRHKALSNMISAGIIS